MRNSIFWHGLAGGQEKNLDYGQWNFLVVGNGEEEALLKASPRGKKGENSTGRVNRATFDPDSLPFAQDKKKAATF